MIEDFDPRLEVLPKPQRRLWDELGAVPADFALYGGNAIALQLGSRQSADFDFFSNRTFDPGELTAAIPFMTEARITRFEPNMLEGFVNRDGAIKVGFSGLPNLPRLEPPLVVPENGLRIASLLDLAGTKLYVIQLRAEAKDYRDIDTILGDGRIDLATAIASAQTLYGPQFNPQVALKTLTFFTGLHQRRLSKAIRQRLVDAVREVDLDRLPTIARPSAPRRARKRVTP